MPGKSKMLGKDVSAFAAEAAMPNVASIKAAIRNSLRCFMIAPFSLVRPRRAAPFTHCMSSGVRGSSQHATDRSGDASVLLGCFPFSAVPPGRRHCAVGGWVADAAREELGGTGRRAGRGCCEREAVAPGVCVSQRVVCCFWGAGVLGVLECDFGVCGLVFVVCGLGEGEGGFVGVVLGGVEGDGLEVVLGGVGG